MHLVQILLPLRDNEGNAFPFSQFEALESELTKRFGGITTYSRSPAEGRWRQRGSEQYEDIVVFEAMAETLDAACW